MNALFSFSFFVYALHDLHILKYVMVGVD